MTLFNKALFWINYNKRLTTTTTNKALHPGDDVDRLYVSRKGRRELVSIEDSVDTSIQRLEDNIQRRGERPITSADCFLMNRNDVEKDPEAQQNYTT